MKGQFRPHKHLNGGEGSATNLQNVLANFWLRAVILCAAMMALGNWIGCTFLGGWNVYGMVAYMTASQDAETANRSTSDAFLIEPWSMVCTFCISDSSTKLSMVLSLDNYQMLRS